MTQQRPVPLAASTLDGTYPRPQLVRAEWVSLDGVWSFGYDDDDQGLAQRWFAGGPEAEAAFARAITVPYPPESAASEIHDTSFHPIVWYRRELEEADLPPRRSASDRVLVHFGAVDYRATIWCDGVLVGTHVGGQTPFGVDVTQAWEGDRDKHMIVVRAHDDTRHAAQPTGKQHWKLEPHGIWYHRTTGIWQTVWAEVVPQTHIADLTWVAEPSARAVSCEVRLSESPPAPLLIDVTLSRGGLAVTRTVMSQAGRASVEIDVTQLAPDRFEALLWSPESPTLIDASVVLREVDGADPIERVSSYVGMRSVAVARGRFLLNGQPRYLRAVLDQGYRKDTHLANPGSDWLRQEVELILQLGFNAVRVHQKAEDPRFMFWADRLGLMMWAETANAREFSEDAIGLLTQEWADLVRRDRSHPCIVTWVPMNESWGVDEVATTGSQQEYVLELVRLTRALDPTRPVVSNDGWEHVDSDIIGIHDYSSRPWRLRGRYGGARRLRRTLRSRGPAKRRLVVTDEQWRRLDTGDVPVMLTEFGGVRFARSDGTWGYATVESSEEYEALLRGLFGAVRASPDLSGFCYTQLLDTLQEANGLLTADREPKLPVATIREIVVGDPG